LIPKQKNQKTAGASSKTQKLLQIQRVKNKNIFFCKLFRVKKCKAKPFYFKEFILKNSKKQTFFLLRKLFY